MALKALNMHKWAAMFPWHLVLCCLVISCCRKTFRTKRGERKKVTTTNSTGRKQINTDRKSFSQKKSCFSSTCHPFCVCMADVYWFKGINHSVTFSTLFFRTHKDIYKPNKANLSIYLVPLFSCVDADGVCSAKKKRELSLRFSFLFIHHPSMFFLRSFSENVCINKWIWT